MGLRQGEDAPLKALALIVVAAGLPSQGLHGREGVADAMVQFVQHHRLPLLQDVAAGDLIAQLALVPLQRRGHGVERLAELAELAASGDPGPRPQLTGTPGAGRREQAPYGSADEGAAGHERGRDRQGCSETDQHHPAPGRGVDVGERRGRRQAHRHRQGIEILRRACDHCRDPGITEQAG